MPPIPDPNGNGYSFTVKPEDLDDAGIYYFKVYRYYFIKYFNINKVNSYLSF